MTDIRFPSGPPWMDADSLGEEDHGIESPLPALEDMVEQVRSGTLTLHDAVEHLVDQAVAPVRCTISATQEVELRGLLREAIAADPTLVALVRGMGEGAA